MIVAAEVLVIIHGRFSVFRPASKLDRGVRFVSILVGRFVN
jgi:hypothetical protein